jgi:hypothetical protein
LLAFASFPAAWQEPEIMGINIESDSQAAYHEAGHAVTAHLLGFTGVWVEMDDGANRAITRHDMLPSILTVAGGGRAVLARYQYEELMYFVAGLVAEEKIAGYPGDCVEEDTAGRPRIDRDAPALRLACRSASTRTVRSRSMLM